MEQKQRAYATFTPLKNYLHITDAGRRFPRETVRHIKSNPLPIDGDTHIAQFYRSNKSFESGSLANTMPGSDFTNYLFERFDYGAGINRVAVIVGWYWTEEK